MEFVNYYFGLCIAVWIIDVIATIMLLIVKPLRKWFMKKLMQLSIEWTESFLEMIPEDWKGKEKNDEDF